ncbi:restriction modification system DNA specificity domain [Methanococcus maripaludis C5]|uniref:Restriction modification system DNA specificity domain n=1 Tax=Methanococcus maripaludis (strain C5 / ATCC BAA-1333) TaxID=402880 RepID=A4FXL8_METM5|nr:restriction endonuclease subunit S [Methanococcus maripaludis]ABO34952.1 restriction modification system DNA specificity domain [Methanococcus maripaludis C5]
MARAMKDSGIEWIGDIPADWGVKKLKYILGLNTGLSITKAELVENGVDCVNYGDIHSKYTFDIVSSRDNLPKVPVEFIDTNPSAIASEGDFIFCDTSEDIEGSGNCLFIRESNNKPIFAGSHTILGRPLINVNSTYLGYLLKSPDIKSQIQKRVVGIKVYSITQKILKSISLILPPVDEQQEIAQYLDDKVGQIDSIIEKTKSSIDEYKSYKQSIITETVTKGLDPTVTMKDSGIEWIGDIPEHWDIIKIRYLGTLQNGISKSSSYFGSGYPFVSYGDVYKNYELPKSVEGLVESNEFDKSNYSVEYGDVFFTRTSETIDEIGFTATCMHTMNDAVFAGFLIRFRPFDSKLLNPLYSKYYFRSDMHRRFFVKEMNLVTRASLSQELLKKLPVLVPPHNEQIAIGKFIEETCQTIDQLITKKQQLITELKAYKKSLIYEVVTGKKEVK